MRTLSRLRRRLAGHPPRRIIGKIGRTLAAITRNAILRWRDRHWSSYARLPDALLAQDLGRFFPRPAAADINQPHLAALTEHYLDHRFDLLGSGWTEVRHGMSCRGLSGHRYEAGPEIRADQDGQWLTGRINRANLALARAAWRHTDPAYIPIDWHLDFKSGHRWREACWYKDIDLGHLAGVDIKLPWELARMQHLPQLALAHACALEGRPGFAAPNRYVQAFRNQILDFIATNPPRFGVNWACAMDVGIRVVNWLVAYDLFRASGITFDRPFRQLLLRSVHEHGRHIVGNLECEGGIRGNHYLANIAGLLFAAAYLPRSAQHDRWLTFAVHELIHEVEHQFHEGGSNFEASTVYHRLSAEIAVYATALVMALPADRQALLKSDMPWRPRRSPVRASAVLGHPLPGGSGDSPFPPSHWQRLAGMAAFTMDITGPGGQVVQIGDNDSGRLLKLQPALQTPRVAMVTERFENMRGYAALPPDAAYLFEDVLDHRHLVAAINGFFGLDGLTRFAVGWEMETAMVHALAGTMVAIGEADILHAQRVPSPALSPRQCAAPSGAVQRYSFTIDGTMPSPEGQDDIRLSVYPDFGLYIYRSARMYLVVRCGPIGLDGLGAHAHNDPLAVELWLDGAPVVVDPGSYIYTALPACRRAYRSVAAHFAPRMAGHEPGSLERDIFALGDEAQAECLSVDRTSFVGRYAARGGHVYRRIAITPAAIVIEDWTDHPHAELERLTTSAGPGYSPAYGWQQRDPLPPAVGGQH